MLIVFLVWILYVILGLFWLKITISRKPNREYSVLGSLFIVTFWPVYLISKILNL
jgi:hypothetical protein